jgi:processive 1,2-diacylglycerol beta-glucosyltransferase
MRVFLGRSASTVGGGDMITLTDKETGRRLGVITEKQLQSLMDELEEESAEDQDYYINRPTLEAFEQSGIDRDLLELLKSAIGNREDMEIAWTRS